MLPAIPALVIPICVLFGFMFFVLVLSVHYRKNKQLSFKEGQETRQLEVKRLELDHDTINPEHVTPPTPPEVLIEIEKTKRMKLELEASASSPEVLVAREQTKQVELDIANRNTVPEVLIEQMRLESISKMVSFSQECLSSIEKLETAFITNRPTETLMDFKEFSQIRDTMNDSLNHIKEVFSMHESNSRRQECADVNED
jgi:hypothetical protein